MLAKLNISNTNIIEIDGGKIFYIMTTVYITVGVTIFMVLLDRRDMHKEKKITKSFPSPIQ